MEVTEEQLYDGVCVILNKGDSLNRVPKTHRRLITPEIREWWHNPNGAMRWVADHAVSPLMGRWFGSMAENGQWRLELHQASHGESRAGFWFTCPDIRGAEVSPPVGKRPSNQLPQELAEYYRLIDYVDWMGFGAAGGFEGGADHTPLTNYAYEYFGDSVDPASTYIFGWSPCSDMIFYTADGRGGWVCHENGKVKLLGSVLNTIDWVYGELLADRCPDYPYG
ncbi:MAG: hypothetical protein K8T89_13070 [Planctomycetes bacterium]|nr:hypothetical protein [Planctomycetota bacterium]